MQIDWDKVKRILRKSIHKDPWKGSDISSAEENYIYRVMTADRKLYWEVVADIKKEKGITT